MLTKDIATQIYTILKQPQLKYLTQVFCFYCFYISRFSFHLVFSSSMCYTYQNMSFLWFPSDSSVIYYFIGTFCWFSCLWYYILVYLVSNYVILHARMISNPCYVNFWQLIQDWSFCRAHLSFKKDMVCLPSWLWPCI